MALNELARSRLANLGRKGSLPRAGMRMVRCPACGEIDHRSLCRQVCPKCGSEMPSNPPNICRLCGEPCPGRRYSWCSDECVDAYNLISSSAALRQATFARDKGICAICGVDCDALQKRVDAMGYEQRGAAFAVLRENGSNVPTCRTSFCGSLWESHHVEPVDEGGSWELSNVQTLCHPCHKEKTAKQAGRRGKQQKLIFKARRRTPEFLRLVELRDEEWLGCLCRNRRA